VLASIVAVGDACGVRDRALDLVGALRARLAEVATRVADLPRPRVAIVEWVDPPFTAGHWVPDLVAAAGGEPVGARGGRRSVETTYAALAATAPDVVLVTPCGFHLDGAAEQARLVTPHFPDARVWAIDGDGLIVRPGPRLVDGVEAIAALLHPEAVPPAGAERIRRVS
jgi:iron complex transport system substrate-binding protein